MQLLQFKIIHRCAKECLKNTFEIIPLCGFHTKQIEFNKEEVNNEYFIFSVM